MQDLPALAAPSELLEDLKSPVPRINYFTLFNRAFFKVFKKLIQRTGPTARSQTVWGIRINSSRIKQYRDWPKRIGLFKSRNRTTKPV